MDELLEKLRLALDNSKAEILFGPAFVEQLENNRFEKRDKETCIKAIISFIRNPHNPGLNFEQLGGRKKANHYSIRGSQELRVILAVEKNGNDRVLFANMGHHEDMYRWSDGRDVRSDLNDRRNLVSITGKKQVSESEKTEDALKKALSGTFELWQLFLPEDMRSMATGKFAGASRVRGAAGTGKSVLALHRAKTLGKRYEGEKILFTTYSRSLANSMKRLFETFPDPPRNVEFRNVDQLVRMMLPGDFELDNKNETFEEAFDASLDASVKRRFRKEYIKEEIENVIRGRNASREEYLDTDRFERLGRLKSLKKKDRELVWNLKEAWDSRLAACGLKTWPQLRIEALGKLLQGKNEPMYRAAIIDEAQDLSLVSMQLIRGLVCGASTEEVKDDAVTMYDDTAQRFYVGGFLPIWVPIDVVGRSNTLAKNYRNRPEILYAAYVVRGDTQLARNEGDDGAAKRPEPVLPSGPKPKFVQVHGSERKFIREEIDRMVRFGSLEYKDIAVLTHRNRDVNEMISELENAGVPCANLYDLRENPTASEGVRIGTFDRGKGLEFRAVFIFRVGETAFYEKKSAEDKGRLFELGDEPLDEEETEARRLLVDRLYVGMMRARDSLYLVADERPVDRIEDAIEKNRVLDMKPEQVAQEWESRKNPD